MDTTNYNAFVDGCPNKNFSPDFDAGIITEINANESYDDCFFGKIKTLQT